MLFNYNKGKINAALLAKELGYIKSMLSANNLEKIKIILDSKIIMFIVSLLN